MKKLLFLIIVLVMSVVVIPRVYAADQTAYDKSSLDSAISALNSADGGTIEITGSFTTSDLITINVSKPIIIDLNGFKIERTGGNTVFEVTSGDVTFKDTKGTGEVKHSAGRSIYVSGSTTKVTLDGGTYTSTQDSEFSIVVDDGATLTVKDNTNITGYYGVVLWGNAPKLIVDGGNIVGKSFAISGNGSKTTDSEITINDGKITSDDTAAIYQPQTGRLTVNDGNITGKIGIVARQGTIEINDGKITATGTEGNVVVGDAKDVEGSPVTVPSGTAVVVDNNSSGYSGKADVTIKGGDFDTTSSDPVVSLKEEENDITIEKGNFNKPVNASYLNSEKWYVDFVIDGEHIVVVGVTKGGKLTADDIPKPTKGGYTFVGWYEEQTYENLFDTASNITANKTVYAKFIKNSTSSSRYYVTFVYDGKSTSVGVDAGAVLDPKEIPTVTKEGYAFSGWYLEDTYENLFYTTNPISKSMTVYAKFVKVDEQDIKNPGTSDNIGVYIVLAISAIAGVGGAYKFRKRFN